MKRESFESMMAWADAQPKPILCKCCGRELTDARSKKRGIGPVCIEGLDRAERAEFREINEEEAQRATISGNSGESEASHDMSGGGE